MCPSVLFLLCLHKYILLFLNKKRLNNAQSQQVNSVSVNDYFQLQIWCINDHFQMQDGVKTK